MSRYDRGKHSKDKIVSLNILALIFLIIAIIIISYYIYNLYLSTKNKSIYEEINKHIAVIENNIGAKEQAVNVKKVIKLKEENFDVVGWIQIENTTIDYPLLQTTNNDYYLTHNYKRQESKYGSIYVKSECNILDDNSNLIIYGHNMKDKQMFNQLLNYMDKNYYNQHKTIKIATEQGEDMYSIVAVFKSKIFYQDKKDVFKYYNYTSFDNPDEYNTFIANCKKMQLYDTGVSAEYGDKLITLVTCEYSQEDGRFVVVAKREKS